MRIEFGLSLCAIAVCNTVNADTLSDLKRSLAGYAARQFIHATIDVTRARHSQGRFLTDDFEGSAAIDVTADGSSTRVTYPRTLLDRAETNRPTAMTLNEVIPSSIENAVDCAGDLLRLVSRGRVVEDRAVMLDGRAARRLRLELPPGAAPGEDATAPKVTDDDLIVWTVDGAVPVAAKRIRKGSAGMLLVHVDTVRTETWTFASYGDHLVAMRFEDRSIVSGSLQHGDAWTVWAVRAADVRP